VWFIQLSKAYLGWAWSICRRLAILAPLPLSVVVFATIVSQLAKLLAFFLPLKIIILIGSARVPRYFPPSFVDIDRDALIIGLGIATVGFYVLYLISDKIVETFTERCAERVTAHSAKLVMFTQQTQIVRNACQQMAESIAALVFTALVIATLPLVYPTVAAAVVAWPVLCLATVALAGQMKPAARAWLEKNVDVAVETASALGFFTITAVIIGQFITGHPVPILIAIISILLSRQLLQRLGTVFTNARALYPRRLVINTLFLRGHKWSSKGSSRRKRVWDIVRAGARREWLPQMLSDVTGDTVTGADMTRWRETGLVDVLAFEAKADAGPESGYLIKLYDPSRSLAAVQEATLLGSVKAGSLPAPALLGSAPVGEHHCHVFENPPSAPLTKAEVKAAKLDLITECWKCQLPRDLVQRYRRSHQLLGQRLATADLERVLLAVETPEDASALEEFGRELERICAILDEMPLAIQNPDIRQELMVRQDTGNVVALHWGRWYLEPVGAGWPNDDKLAELPLWLAKAGEARPDIARLAPEHAQLAAIAHDLEKLLNQQRFRAAIALMPRVVALAQPSAPARLRQAS
jgi:hypothetical protein